MQIPPPIAASPAKAVLKQITDDLYTAHGLLSRLPLPAHPYQGNRAAWAWPVVGLSLSLIAALVIFLGTALSLAAGPLAALALLLLAALTGGLHEDGLADTADGLWGGKDPAARLSIMKDSRIGSYGALALIFTSLANWSALSALITDGRAIPALIAAACLSRVPMAVMLYLMPSARAAGQGLAVSLGRPPLVAVLFALTLALLIATFAIGITALGLGLLCGATSLALGRMAFCKIGGQTGDILGASQQLAFTACLCALA